MRRARALVLFAAATVVVTSLVPAPAAAIPTRRLSTRAAEEGNANSGSPISVSANGRYVAYASEATNLESVVLAPDPGARGAVRLVPLPDTNGVADIFVHDLLTGTNRRVSVNGATEANGPSRHPSITADGRYVAFESEATNLAPGSDTNQSPDVFVHDLLDGSTVRISGRQNAANGASTHPALSPDGTYIVFVSDASDLDPFKPASGHADIFFGTRTGQVAAITFNDGPADGSSSSPSIGVGQSGIMVAFSSEASNLVDGDTNGLADVFVWRSNAGPRLALLSNAPGGADGPSRAPSVSPSGTFIAFESDARNLVPGDMNDQTDIFVTDLETGIPQRLTLVGGRDIEGPSTAPAAADDGSVAFRSEALNLPGAVTGQPAVYLWSGGHIAPVTFGIGGEAPNGPSGVPAIAATSHVIAYSSDASNLVPGDTNGFRDVFARLDETSCANGASETGPVSGPVHALGEGYAGPAESLVHHVNCRVVAPLGL